MELVILLSWVAFFGGIWALVRSSRRASTEQALTEEIRRLRVDLRRLDGDRTASTDVTVEVDGEPEVSASRASASSHSGGLAISPRWLASRLLGFFAAVSLATVPWHLGSETRTLTQRYESIECGSVVAPTLQKVFPLPLEADEAVIELGVARQAACAEARSMRLGLAVGSAASGAALAAGAVACSRFRRRHDRPAAVTTHDVFVGV